MNADPVTVDREERIATITLNRPNAMNAITEHLLDELHATLQELEEDEDIRAIILTGAGDDFCAGADLHEMQDLTADDATEWSERAEDITTLLETTGKMTIAAIHGHCLGGGNELALACDIRIATEDAVFGQPETRVGLTPGFGATARLPRLIGRARAKTLLLTGKRIDANEAHKIGLVNEPVSGDVVEEAKTFAREMFEQHSPLSYELTKRILYETADMSLDDALSKERAYFGKIFGTHDQEEGIAAFLEKRDPDFTGD